MPLHGPIAAVPSLTVIYTLLYLRRGQGFAPFITAASKRRCCPEESHNGRLRACRMEDSTLQRMEAVDTLYLVCSEAHGGCGPAGRVKLALQWAKAVGRRVKLKIWYCVPGRLSAASSTFNNLCRWYHAEQGLARWSHT
jgi:hypothetical protein